MSITALEAIALTAAQNIGVTLVPANAIGSITIDAFLEEQHTDTLEVTDNPVESGTVITDHSFMRPFEVVLKCGWSNASANALQGVVSAFSSGSFSSVSDYVHGIYSQLLSLQQSRTPFTIVTPLRTYVSMLMTQLMVERDEKTAQALMVTATCRQIIYATTQTAQLPPQANQADPASTASAGDTQLGEVNVASQVTPAPYGSVPFTLWTAPPLADSSGSSD